MKLSRNLLLATFILGAAAPAAAQVNAHASLGFATSGKSFDTDGKREKTGADSSALLINLGAHYRFFKGLGAGIDLGIARITSEPDGGDKLEAFGLRDLLIGLVWNTVTGPQGEIDASLGFAIDLGTKTLDLKAKETPTSDNQHAIVAKVNYRHQVHPFVRTHFRLGLALPLTREEEKNGVKIEHDRGFVIDPALGVAYHHPRGFNSGLDIGFFFQSDTKTTTDSAGKEKKEGSYALHLIPWVGWALGPAQHVRLMFAARDEYALVGLPVIGKNYTIALIPVTLAWHGRF